VIVVDASTMVAILFDEPSSDQIAKRLENAVLAAPTLLPYEVANSCLKKIIRHKEVTGLWLEAFAALQEWEIEYHAVDTEQTVQLAAQFGLTAYDASYLWLAKSLDAELVTLDEELAAAFARS
jgi:predicted nucleic acid-binding protein